MAHSSSEYLALAEWIVFPCLRFMLLLKTPFSVRAQTASSSGQCEQPTLRTKTAAIVAHGKRS
eukprot:5987203-Pleurochrysis_carterae.AAC.1